VAEDISRFQEMSGLHGATSLQDFLGKVDTSLPPPPMIPDKWSGHGVGRVSPTTLNGGSGGLDKEFDRLLSESNVSN
jgi:hypothetical protein